MEHFQISGIPQDLYKDMKKLSEDIGITMNKLVRDMFRDYLAGSGEPVKQKVTNLNVRGFKKIAELDKAAKANKMNRSAFIKHRVLPEMIARKKVEIVKAP